MSDLLETLSAMTGMPQDIVAGWALILIVVVIGALAGVFEDRGRRR